MSTASDLSACAFCKIIKGETPSFMIKETDLSYAFVALPPVTEGHTLVVPKYHAAKMHELPDDYLADVITLAKRVALSQGLENYNIIQNNGKIADQSVFHVHFHVINKPDEESGLRVAWPPRLSQEKLKTYFDQVFDRCDAMGKTSVPDKRIGEVAFVGGRDLYAEAVACIPRQE